jgi:hypothetical protein
MTGGARHWLAQALDTGLIGLLKLTLPLLSLCSRLDVNVLMVVAILGALVTGDVVEALAVIVVVMGGDRVRDWGMQTVATMLQDAGGRLAPQVPSCLTGREREKGDGSALAMKQGKGC